LHSWVLKLDCEDVVCDGSFLPHQLIQAMVCHDAIALCIRVHAMIVAWSLAVNGHPEANRLSIFHWTKHEMQVAGMKMEYDLPIGRFENRNLFAIDPIAGKSPLIQSRLGGRNIELLAFRLIPPGDAKCSARV